MTKDKHHHHKPEKGEDKPMELLDHPSYQELLRKLDETEQKANEYWERILRMDADSKNMQRRIERDVENAHKYGLEKFVSEMIPIVDSLELAQSSVPEGLAENAASFVEGVNLTHKMLMTALEKFGVKQVNPVSQPFNPELEQAISMQLDQSVKPGTVLTVLQKGFTLNNRLLRAALVVVSKDKE